MRISASFESHGSALKVNILMPKGTPSHFNHTVHNIVTSELTRKVYGTKMGSSAAQDTFRQINAQFALAHLIVELGIPL